MVRMLLTFFIALITLLFHLKRVDTSYQTGDAGHYLVTAQEIYLQPTALERISFAYSQRQWKPILVPHLLVPFLIFKNGDTRAAFDLYRTVLSPFLSAGIFLLMSELIPHLALAFLGALILNCAPWLLTSQIEFGSELPWLLFSVWFLFFWIRGQSNWASGFLLLSALVRPVETAICLGVPFAAYCGEQERGFKWLTVLAAAAVAVALVPYLILHDEYSMTAQWTIAAVTILFASVRRTRWTVVLALLVLWYLPGFWKLLDWTFRSTASELSIGLTDYLAWAKHGYVAVFVMSMGPVLMLPALLASTKSRRLRRMWQTHWPRLKLWLWVAAAFPIICAFSHSRDMRYQYLSYIAIFILGFYSLTVAWRKRFALGAAVVILMIQAYGALPLYALENWARTTDAPWPRVAAFTGDQSGIKNTYHDVPFENFFDELTKMPIERDAVLLFIHRREFEASHNTTSPLRYQLRARERGLMWKTEPLMRTEDRQATDAQLIESALAQANTFLVGPAGTDPMSSKDWQAARIAAALWACSEQGKNENGCESMGLKLIGRHHLFETFRHPAQTYLVFKKKS